MKRKGFSMLDLLLAMVVMAILVAILFPVLAHSKERGKSAKCIMNCKAIVQSLQSYANDWGNKLPHPGGFTPQGNFPGYNEAIQSHVKNRKIFYCPSQLMVYTGQGYLNNREKFAPEWNQLQRGMVSYGINSLRYGQMQNPPPINTLCLGNLPFPSTRVILLAEVNDGSHTAYPEYSPGSYPGKSGNIDHQRHNGQSNYVFFDGHVKALTFDTTIKSGMWTITGNIK